jgi:hypothetical protein
MRIMLAAAVVLALAWPVDAARADPYRWCAEYSGGDFGGGSTSCYFWTWEQCMAAVSGVGGFCRVNTFFDGRPVTTPEDSPRRPAAKRRG